MTIFDVRTFIDQQMSDKSQVPTVQASKRRDKGEGIVPPKFILKIIEKTNRSAVTNVYFCKNALITDLIENWGKSDLIVQQYVIQKTLQPCVYRFYRNSRNVYRSECIINKKSLATDEGTRSVF